MAEPLRSADSARRKLRNPEIASLATAAMLWAPNLGQHPGIDMSDKHNDDNHANQLNPNHDAFWQSRGYDERPDDWEDRAG